MDTTRARDLLARAGLRATSHRLAVLRLLAGLATPLTAQDVHARLRRRGRGPGLVTVYRTLGALAQAGILDTFEREGERSYRLCGGDHHHHLVCVSCGAVEEVDGGEVEDWVWRASRRRGFRPLTHRAEVYGRCRACP